MTGTVVDYQGKVVEGVTVTRFSGQPVKGIGTSVTDKAGRFRIDNLPLTKRNDNKPSQTAFSLLHPDHPDVRVLVNISDERAVLKLPRPCHIRGTVIDKETGQPSSGVFVNCHRLESGQRLTTVSTNERGEYHFVVQEGLYYVVAIKEARICKAIEDVEVVDGETMKLKPLYLERGGFITGKVVDGNTGNPIATNNQGEPLQIGLFGPSKPFTKVISQTPSITVDANGEFVLRAAPGDNHLYFVNERGDQMAWNTRKRDPLVVEEGKRVRATMTITPPVPKEKKMEHARRTVAKLSKEPNERTRQILAEFRKLNHTVDETELWCSLMRELVRIGSPAVPHLLKELESTDQNRMIRRLGFALRAIDDKRAIPGLIRAIPKSLFPGCSDYGLLVEDPELSAFMKEHDNDRNRRGRHFSLGRPVREVFSALHELSGKDFDDNELYSIHLREHPREQFLQRSLFQRKAKKWQAWWNKNWTRYVDDVNYGSFELEKLPPFDPANQIPFSGRFVKGSTAGEGTAEMTLSPIGEPGTKFLDLDTGFRPKLDIAIPNTSDRQAQLSEWTAGNGADLMCEEIITKDGTVSYVLRGFGLRLWRIKQRDVENLEKRLRTGNAELSPFEGDLLTAVDPVTKKPLPNQNASFVFETRQGGLGVIQITDRITKVQDLTGQPAGFGPKGVGFFKGVKFNFRSIYMAQK